MPTRDPKPPSIPDATPPPKVEGEVTSELEQLCELANAAIREYVIPSMLKIHADVTKKYTALRKRALRGEGIDEEEVATLWSDLRPQHRGVAIEQTEAVLANNFLVSTLFGTRMHDLEKGTSKYIDYLQDYLHARKHDWAEIPELPIVEPLDTSKLLVRPENLELTKRDSLSEVLKLLFELSVKKDLAERNVQLSVKSDEEIRIDHYVSLTMACFEELAKNAADTMPSGGKLDVQAKTTGNTISITFKDTGEGMSPETLQKALAGGFTTKQAGTGRGLGLMKDYFEKILKGKMEIASEESIGTTITIKLPLAK